MIIATTKETTLSTIKDLFKDIKTTCDAATLELETYSDLTEQDLLYWVSEIESTLNTVRTNINSLGGETL
jgi:hypothetical protein